MGWRLLALVALSLAVAPTAHAGKETRQQTARDKPDEAIVVEGEKDPKKIVRRGAVSTGSIIRKQTCLTKESWGWREAKDRETAQALKEQQNRDRTTRQMICMIRNANC